MPFRQDREGGRGEEEEEEEEAAVTRPSPGVRAGACVPGVTGVSGDSLASEN